MTSYENLSKDELIKLLLKKDNEIKEKDNEIKETKDEY